MFRYYPGRGIHQIWHAEGPAKGGQFVRLEGNYRAIPATDTLAVKFGNTPVAVVVSRSESLLKVQVAAAALPAGELRLLVPLLSAGRALSCFSSMKAWSTSSRHTLS